MKHTTKECRECGSRALHHFTSMRMKRCADCGHEMPWHLAKDQAPLVGPARSMRAK